MTIEKYFTKDGKQTEDINEAAQVHRLTTDESGQVISDEILNAAEANPS